MDSDAPSSTGSQGPSKPKVNWKNGPPSCKECVRLKLKVRGGVTSTPLTPVFALVAVHQLCASRM